MKPHNPFDLTSTIESLLSNDIADYSVKYTKELRAASTAAGWPVLVVSQLEVTLDNGLWTVIPPSSIKEEVTNLEEGIPGLTPPNPVIRTYMKTLENKRVA